MKILKILNDLDNDIAICFNGKCKKHIKFEKKHIIKNFAIEFSATFCSNKCLQKSWKESTSYWDGKEFKKGEY